MATEYYLIIDETRQGPFSIEELATQNITPETLVWRVGLADWTKAKEVADLYEVLNAQEAARQGFQQGSQPYNGNGYPNFAANPQYGNQPKPDFARNPQYGQTPYNPNPYGSNGYGQNGARQYGQQYGQNGAQQNGQQYGQQYGQNPQYDQNPQYGQPQYGQTPYGQQPNYGQNPQYGHNNGYDPMTGHKNWLTLAIVATVVGFIFSCVGGIIGIVAIIQANKANDAYMLGNEMLGDSANSSARTLTIIAFALAGLGLVWSIIQLFGFFSVISSY